MLTFILGEINSNTIIVGDFNTSLLPMDRSSRQKINKEIEALKWQIRTDELNWYQRTFHTKAAGYIFFFTSAHGIFSMIDHSLGHKSSLGKHRKLKLY